MKKVPPGFFLVVSLITIKRWRRGGKGHRISGDTAVSRFHNRRLRFKKKFGGEGLP